MERMSAAEPLRVAYLTAGAAGMICGNCLHDNTLARALMKQGVAIQLLPTYTPIRTDEMDSSLPRVFLGGVNVYLNQTVPGYHWLPRWLKRWLDAPAVVRWLTQGAPSVDAKQLGPLTISMLRGDFGVQRGAIGELCDYLVSEVRPHLVVLTSSLLSGCIPAIRRATGARVLVTLQGDDLFLDQLPELYRARAIAEIRQRLDSAQGCLAHSAFYADFMARYLGIARSFVQLVPLGIETSDFAVTTASEPVEFTIGYLARLAPEKGLHVLVDAFLELRKRAEFQRARLHVAGWLGPQQKSYWAEQEEKLKQAGAGDDYRYFGEVDRAGKIDFLRKLSVFSVPTVHPEPKGLFALEAMAAGIPVVLPDAGAFPEMIASTGGGLLFPSGNAVQLAERFAEMADRDMRRKLGEEGRRAVLANRNAESMARETLAVWRRARGDDARVE